MLIVFDPMLYCLHHQQSEPVVYVEIRELIMIGWWVVRQLLG
jgi:hypothetical protein